MKDTRLLDKFNEVKLILCRYDYYIHIPKKILHLTNGELKIPHLMGLQYIAKEGINAVSEMKRSEWQKKWG
ncbi:MAG: hypothetical protein K2N87_15380 [Eubacterium sp.]|nr:hypothetical protein [Eubacterium sp.]